MKKFLLLDNYAPHPTFSYPDNQDPKDFRQDGRSNLFALERFFPDENILWDVVEVEKYSSAQFAEVLETINSYDGVFLGGSPFSVNDEFDWIAREKKFLQDVIDTSDTPVFGICFGHQMLATIFGGKVDSHSRYIQEKISFIIENQKITASACHGEYVSTVPDNATILGVGENNMPYLLEYNNSSKVFGAQVHIEEVLDQNTDSEQFWKNFFQTF